VTWDLKTKKQVSRCLFPNTEVLGLALAQDGHTAVVTARGGDIHLRDVRRGQDFGSIKPDWSSVCSPPVFSPDGRTLVFTVLDENADYSIRLIEWASRKQRKIFRVDNASDLLAFSPDGQLLASGHLDTSILLWRVAGAGDPRQTQAAPLAKLWQGLRSDDAVRAGEAIAELIKRSDRSLPLFQSLKPIPVVKLAPSEVTRLVADLGSEKHTIRYTSEQKLRQASRAVEPLLRKALASEKDLEVRLRLQRMLAILKQPTTEEVFQVRCVEVLEGIGTPAARTKLKELAGGEPSALLTREASAALRRLAGRRANASDDKSLISRLRWSGCSTGGQGRPRWGRRRHSTESCACQASQKCRS
jgi:hypothetical protein